MIKASFIRRRCPCNSDSCLFFGMLLFLLNSWYFCEARLAEPFNEAIAQQQQQQQQQQQRQEEERRRRLTSCSETENQCKAAGIDGYIMHNAQFLVPSICSELCIPTFLSNIRYSIGWKCGPCTIRHQGTTSVYSATGSGMVVQRPVTSATDDLLLLFLSRTDDLLPLYLDGWETGPVCLKSENKQEKCHRVKDCKKWNGDYCLKFGGKGKDSKEDNDGQDLATAVFYRTVQSDEPFQYTFTLDCADENECYPAWAILTALRGADNDDPIYDSATKSFDEVSESVFPSVCGDAGDMLLLHMAFDDGYTSGTGLFNFLPPAGTSLLGEVIGNDEAGFLFGEVLESSGETGSRTTTGLGEDAGKDAMISLIVRKKR